MDKSRKFERMMAKLPLERQRQIRSAVAACVHETPLREIRKASTVSQTELAARLGQSQVAVCRLERRDDMLISTLRRYIDALGGRLEILACFPDRDLRIAPSPGSSER
jgi:predicted transcriptional regulator